MEVLPFLCEVGKEAKTEQVTGQKNIHEAEGRAKDIKEMKKTAG